MEEDYYKILSVEPTPSQAEIDEAARKLITVWSKRRKTVEISRQQHIEVLSQIEKASRVLTDPVEKMHYDEHLGLKIHFSVLTTRKEKDPSIPLKLSESIEALETVKIPGELDYDKLEKFISKSETLLPTEPRSDTDSNIDHVRYSEKMNHKFSFNDINLGDATRKRQTLPAMRIADAFNRGVTTERAASENAILTLSSKDNITCGATHERLTLPAMKISDTSKRGVVTERAAIEKIILTASSKDYIPSEFDPKRLTLSNISDTLKSSLLSIGPEKCKLAKENVVSTDSDNSQREDQSRDDGILDKSDLKNKTLSTGFTLPSSKERVGETSLPPTSEVVHQLNKTKSSDPTHLPSKERTDEISLSSKGEVKDQLNKEHICKLESTLRPSDDAIKLQASSSEMLIGEELKKFNDDITIPSTTEILSGNIQWQKEKPSDIRKIATEAELSKILSKYEGFAADVVKQLFTEITTKYSTATSSEDLKSYLEELKNFNKGIRTLFERKIHSENEILKQKEIPSDMRKTATGTDLSKISPHFEGHGADSLKRLLSEIIKKSSTDALGDQLESERIPDKSEVPQISPDLKSKKSPQEGLTCLSSKKRTDEISLPPTCAVLDEFNKDLSSKLDSSKRLMHEAIEDHPEELKKFSDHIQITMDRKILSENDILARKTVAYDIRKTATVADLSELLSQFEDPSTDNFRHYGAELRKKKSSGAFGDQLKEHDLKTRASLQ